MSSSSPANAAPAVAPSDVREFSIRVPKNSRKRYNLMRFNSALNVKFEDWKQVKLERENLLRDNKVFDEELPKFGAGSEFGREQREEARRKKYGINKRSYKAEDQPWILKVNGKTGKKFKGIREGGVSANASFYVFTHAPDGGIDAFPLQEWYNFTTIQRYKALNAEEAEEEFSRRNRTINYFSLMLRKKMHKDEEGADDEDTIDGTKSKKTTKKKDKDLKISEMEDWMDSDDDDSDADEKEDNENSGDDELNKKKKKKGNLKKKKKNKSDDEAFEESDDGDEEGRECEYMSESSASDSELEAQKEIKSVAEEDALRKLLNSDEEDEDESGKEKNEDEDEKKEDEDKNKDDKDKDKSNKDTEKKKDKKKKVKNKKDIKKGGNSKESSSEWSQDSESDTEISKDKAENKKPNSTQSSRSVTPVPTASESLKRSHNGSPDTSQVKKPKLEHYNSASNSSYISGASEFGVTEDAVRRYLMRKPMTTTELLQKFKSKKTGLSSDQLVNIMTQILKKINPTKQTIKNKMYLSIKAQPK